MFVSEDGVPIEISVTEESVPVSLGGNLVYQVMIDTNCSLATVQLMQLSHANWRTTLLNVGQIRNEMEKWG